MLEASERQSKRRGVPLKILFCAVSDEVRALARSVLFGNPGSQVITADDASAALSLIARESPSVVVVGGSSPRIVAESCERIRAADRANDLLILATSSGENADARTLLEAGADDLLLEPTTESALRCRLLVARRALVVIETRRTALAVHLATEEALERSTESLATMLDSIGDGVVATDTSGLIVRMNPIAERLTGWTFEQARRRPLAEVLPLVNEDTRISVANPTDQPLREGISVSLARRTLLIRRDGVEVPVADSCAPIKSKRGEITGAVLVFRDLKVQREAETAQAKSQEQLVFADRMASVGTLAAGIAHEINNPLTYVAANIDVAVEELRGHGETRSVRLRELENMLIDAREGTVRIAKIVRGLKLLTRIDESKPVTIDLLPVIQLSLDTVANEMRHHATVMCELGQTPLVVADGARLAQVFINLLVNASHAFEEGPSETNEIHVTTSTDNRGRAAIEIRDNGMGIPEERLGRIFDPFFTTKPVGVGTGLGLAISLGILNAIGGDIAVRSAVGHGTTFRVTLPPSMMTRASEQVRRGDSVPASKRSARVLVVDDEPAVGNAIRRVLRQHDVTVVTSAQQALDVIDTRAPFDVVLSDLMMPGASGMDLHRQLVELHPETAAKMVFITGGAFTPEASAFLHRVVNRHIEKPFNFDHLRTLVLELAS